MTRTTGKSADGSAVCAVHATTERCAVVVARATGTGVQLLHHEVLSAQNLAGISSLCDRYKVERVVRVAPASRCVARVVETPVADAASMSGAVALLAEARLPPDIPAHRRAGAVLPDEARNGVRLALLTAWSGPGAAPISKQHAESWVTPHGVLAGLRSADADAGVYVSAAEAAAILLSTRGERAMARTVILPPEPRGTFLKRAADALRAGVAGTVIEAATSREGTWIGGGVDGLAVRVSGARVDEAFVRDFGLALGAAMVALDRPDGLGTLAGLGSDAPREVVPVPVRFASWISRPRVAAALSIASAAALLAGPWGLTRARASIAREKAAQLENAKSQTKDISLRAAVYQELETARWPMTKLLSDISGAAPVGVTIEDVRLTVGQGIVVRGAAESRELVNEFEKNLGQTRLFQSIKQNRNEGKAGGGAEFDISAAPGSNLHAPVKPVADFANTTLAAALYGEGASNTTMPVGARREPVRRIVRTGSGDSTSDRTSGDSRRPSTASSAEPPPAVSDAEIAAMDRSTAMRGWTSRRSFLQKNPGVDSSVKQRLESEIEKMRDRMNKAGASEGGRS